MKKKVTVVFGTRPEAIKMAPLVKALQARPGRFETRVCVTAQHRELLDGVLRLFGIVPDADLDIMSPGQDLFDITSRVLTGLKGVFGADRPDAVLVHGDTTTTMAAALAAFYLRIPVGHVEAGLRTGDIYSPWPEEMNRQIAGRIARWHFAPTETARGNLLREGVPEGAVSVTGNTVVDALLWTTGLLDGSPDARESAEAGLERAGLPRPLLRSWREGGRRCVLVTGHRRENFGRPFLQICSALKRLAGLFPDADFVYPMHPNPNVRGAVRETFAGAPAGNVRLIEPLDYLPFVALMRASRVVLTDSGGIQEEAPGLGKPVLVMRDTTERPEAVEAGTVKLVGADEGRIVREVSRLLTDPAAYAEMAAAANPYGDGRASERICGRIEAFE